LTLPELKADDRTSGQRSAVSGQLRQGRDFDFAGAV